MTADITIELVSVDLELSRRPIGCRSVGNRSPCLSPTIADLAILLVDIIGRVAERVGDDTTLAWRWISGVSRLFRVLQGSLCVFPI